MLLPVFAAAQLTQQKTIDSIEVLASKTKNDTAKIILLSELSSLYYTINNKAGIDLGNRALTMAQKIGFKNGIFKAYCALGKNYWATYNFIQAQDYYGTALKIAQETGNKGRIAVCLNGIGVCYAAENNYPQAETYYKRVLEIDKKAGAKDKIGGDLSHLADLYISQSKYGEAIQLFKESSRLAQQLPNLDDVAYRDRRIGEIYADINNYTEALNWAMASVRLYAKLNNFASEADARGTLGAIYLQFKDYPAAIAQYRGALALLNERQNIAAKGTAITGTEADIYFCIGDCYSQWGGVADTPLIASKKLINPALLNFALQNFDQALSLAKSKGYIENIAKTLKERSEIESSLGRFGTALRTFKEYIMYRDSLNKLHREREYKQHELAFEYSKKRDSLNYAEKLQGEELRRVKATSAVKLKQLSLYTVVAVTVLLLIVSYFVFRNRIQKINFKNQLANEKAEVELKQALFENKLNDLTLASLKAQMNPHFIFNCLNSIKLYVEKNETNAASSYITKFSKLIRTILDSARSETVMLADEIELTRLYLEMESMRLKDRLCYKLDIAKDIDTEFIEVPPLLIQPYIENAIWHGIMNKPEGGAIHLTVAASPDQKYLIINVSDNGIGRKKSAELKSKSVLKHISHGIKLNNERIEIFNAKYKTNTEVVINDLFDGEQSPAGTAVNIKLLIR